MRRQHDVDATLSVVVSGERLMRGYRGLFRGFAYYVADQDLIWKGKKLRWTESWATVPQAVGGHRLNATLFDPSGRKLYDIGVALQWAAIMAERTYEERPTGESYEPDAVRWAAGHALVELVENRNAE